MTVSSPDHTGEALVGEAGLEASLKTSNLMAIGMAQVLPTLAYGVQGLRRGVTTWDWPSFNTNPARENSSQMERWSLNVCTFMGIPSIANQYHDQRSNQPQNVRYRLILVRASDLDWLQKDQHSLRNLHQIAAAGHNWIPVQDLPFDELILFAYAADRTPRPTYVCLPSGLYHAPDGSDHKPALPKKSHRCQAFASLMGGECSQHWTSHPTCQAPKRRPHMVLEQPRIPLCENLTSVVR